MDQLRIRGGRRLAGEIVISSAKNAALPDVRGAAHGRARQLQNAEPERRDDDGALRRRSASRPEMGERGKRR
jgi:hypothetical protein